MKRFINTILLLSVAIIAMAQTSFVVADKNGNSQLVQSLVFQQQQTADRFSWKSDGSATGDINDLLFIARAKAELATANTEDVTKMLEELSGTDLADAEAIAAALRSNPNVEESFTEDGGNVIMKKKGSDTYVVYPLYEDEPLFSGADIPDSESGLAKSHKAKRGRALGDVYRGKIAIFNHFQGMSSYKIQNNIARDIEKKFTTQGYDVEYYGNNNDPAHAHSSNVAYDHFFDHQNMSEVIRNSADYKAIIIFSHGFEKNGKTYFSTCEKAYSQQEIEEGCYCYTPYCSEDAYYYTYPVENLKINNNCIVYLGSCYGIPEKGNVSFLDEKKTVLIGWKGKNCVAQVDADLLFYYMLFENYDLNSALEASFKYDVKNDNSIRYPSKYVKDQRLAGEEEWYPEYMENGLNVFLKDGDEYVDKNTQKNGIIKGDFNDKWNENIYKFSLKPLFGWMNVNNYKCWIFDKNFTIGINYENIPEGMYLFSVEGNVKPGVFQPIKQTNVTRHLLCSEKPLKNNSAQSVTLEDVYTPSILDIDGQPVSEITLSAGTSKTFDIDGYSGHAFHAPCLNKDVVNASVNGTKLTVTGVSEGTTYIGVYDTQNKMLSAAEVTVTAGSPQPEPYAVLSDDGMTVTFYYDTKKTTRGGMEINDQEYDDESPYGTATKAVIDVSFADYRPTSTAYWFAFCPSLSSIIGMENLKTDYVVDMARMFMFCNNLTTLDLSRFNTEKVGNMADMFYSCKSLTSLDLSNFITNNVVTMNGMFMSCSGLKTLDLSNFRTYKVSDMGYMFWGCSSLTNVNLSSFETFRVYSTREMFKYCSSLKTIDLSSFRTDKLNTMMEMFSGCENLTTVYVDEYKWILREDAEFSGMFTSCYSLVGGNGTKLMDVLENEIDDTEYVRVDKEGTPGYLTAKYCGIPEPLSCPDDNHPHMIDLGLPSGTLWACCNVGASKPEEFGGYYSWGATDEDKSCYDLHIDIDEISGTDFDVAHVKWGSPWHLPTREQVEELCEYTTHDSFSLNGVASCEFTGDNGRKLYLPITKIHYDCYGLYWSSTAKSHSPWYLIVSDWGNPHVDADSWGGTHKLSVRPVCNN